MYKDEMVEFIELTNTEVCCELRSALSSIERLIVDGRFNDDMTIKRASALKIAFDEYRKKMLEERNGIKL